MKIIYKIHVQLYMIHTLTLLVNTGMKIMQYKSNTSRQSKGVVWLLAKAPLKKPTRLDCYLNGGVEIQSRK